jgi:hypothetical protein
MATIWVRDRAQRFYAGIGLFGLAAIAIGFSTTYFIPMTRGTLAVPRFVHLHGLSALAWTTLLFIQALLVRSGRTALHMRIGKAAVPLAILIWASGIFTAAWAARRDLPEQGVAAEASFAGTLIGLSLFVGFVCAGYISRRRPAAHKRWMALATIAVLWPAVFRWRHLLPPMNRPDIILGLFVADLPILAAMLRDRLRYGQVHPVWLIGGTFWFVEQGFEVAIFDTHWGAPLGRVVLQLIP